MPPKLMTASNFLTVCEHIRGCLFYAIKS